MEKYLVIRFSSIGDIILTTPVLTALKQHKPKCEIHFLTKSSFSFLVEHNPNVNRVIAYKNKVSEVKKQLKEENYDAILDLHHNARSLKVKYWLRGVKAYAFNKLNVEKWLYVNFGTPKLPKVHIVDRYLETLKFIGNPPGNLSLSYYPNPAESIDNIQLPKDCIAVVMGATYTQKKLSVPKLASIIEAHPDKHFVLLGGKTDVEDANMLQTENPSIQVLNLVGKLSFDQSALVLKESTLVITNDTGLMHAAAAFQKPIISIWCGTVPEFGMFPYNTNQFLFMAEPKHLTKRPCSKLGNRCQYKFCACVEQLPEQEIIDAISGFFADKNQLV